MSADVCADWQPRINEWVDGTIASVSAEGLQRHLSTCPGCRQLATDLATIRTSAQALPDLEPPTVVWEAIVTDIATSPRTQRHSGHSSPSRRLAWCGLAAAAGLAALLVGFWPRGASPLEEDLVTSGTLPSVEIALARVDVEMGLAQEAYARAMGGVIGRPDGWEREMAMDLDATVRQQLGMIEAAMTETRLALESDPESAVARRSLIEVTRRKAVVLQHAVTATTQLAAYVE